ncbi:two-component system, sporulation sensor kinase A [Mesobacillus persicus]|uniref:histidine kinase n=1 Tax=Mesobacillus persicus TaxID=930146 RepID=A0A1H8AZ67_9BACI|nr:ATP-binding protein [Mesobacillus persicus]SEM75803.1 two-component system, sporulation sensor kinase A [Mesobacillus persicus]
MSATNTSRRKSEKNSILMEYLEEDFVKGSPLFTHNHDAMCILDLDMKVVKVNSAFETLSGYSYLELKYMELQSLFPLDKDKVFQNFERSILGQVQSYDCTMTNKLNDTFEIKMISMPISVLDEIVGFQSIILERTQTHEDLLNSEKLSVSSQLAAGIAHEVRNPITSIKGFLQLMKAEVQHSDYFKIVEGEIEKIEVVLSELLVLANPNDANFKNENLKSLIENVKTLFHTQAISNNIKIDVSYDFENGILLCDRNQIKQVFINLIKNAFESMPDGGTLTIESKHYNDKNIKISIKDTGIGMPQEIVKKMGQPFFTTKEGRIGLGVMLSKQIIKNHNGSVQFWSDTNGTSVEIILPISLLSLKK